MIERMTTVKQKTDWYNYCCCPERLPHQSYSSTKALSPYHVLSGAHPPSALWAASSPGSMLTGAPVTWLCCCPTAVVPLRAISASGTITRLPQGRGPHLVPVTQAEALSTQAFCAL